MKKGFTLLELVIVILIIGVLATLGLTQYGRVVERSRGAEARTILGDVRKYAAAYRLQHNDLTGITNNDVDIGPGIDQIPDTCKSSHYFQYTISPNGADEVVMTATRCTGGGKIPDNPNAGAMANGGTLALTSDLSTGVDTWSGDY